jgi:hypothetical protein
MDIHFLLLHSLLKPNGWITSSVTGNPQDIQDPVTITRNTVLFFHIADSPHEPGSQYSRVGFPAPIPSKDRHPQPSGVPL